MIYDSLKDLFVNDLTGSYLMISLIFLIVIFGLLFMIKSPKEVFIGMTAIYLYFLSVSGLFPSWIFFIAIMVMGLSIGSGLIKLFYTGG